jgi:hypothetical protein
MPHPACPVLHPAARRKLFDGRPLSADTRAHGATRQSETEEKWVHVANPGQRRAGSGASPQCPIVTDRPREHPRNLLPGDSRAWSLEGSWSSWTYTPDLRTRARSRQESHRHIDGFARGVCDRQGSRRQRPRSYSIAGVRRRRGSQHQTRTPQGKGSGWADPARCRLSWRSRL